MKKTLITRKSNAALPKAAAAVTSAMPIFWSDHARQRATQRGIALPVAEAVAMCGRREHDHRGGVRVDLRGVKSRRRFVELAGSKYLERFEDVYVVLAADWPVIITVGWRYERAISDPSPIRSPRVRVGWRRAAANDARWQVQANA